MVSRNRSCSPLTQIENEIRSRHRSCPPLTDLDHEGNDTTDPAPVFPEELDVRAESELQQRSERRRQRVSVGAVPPPAVQHVRQQDHPQRQHTAAEQVRCTGGTGRCQQCSMQLVLSEHGPLDPRDKPMTEPCDKLLRHTPVINY